MSNKDKTRTHTHTNREIYDKYMRESPLRNIQHTHTRKEKKKNKGKLKKNEEI